MSYTTRQTCRLCDHQPLTPLYSLGTQFVSDFVKRENVHTGIQCRIDIVMCERCSLVQQLHTVDPTRLYRHYHYRSGVTQTMRDALRDITKSVEDMDILRSGDVVCDIGSNDSTLLRSYTAPNIIRVGVEPALNLAEEGRKGLRIFINDLWSKEAYFDAVYGKAKVITAIGMLYDLEEPNKFVGDVAACLDRDGVFVAQLMCLQQMMEAYDVGNLAHEHLELYSLRSFDLLLQRHGLQVFSLQHNKVNGGSYRFWISHIANKARVRSSAFDQSMRWEEEDKLHEPATHAKWDGCVNRVKNKVVGYVMDELKEGRTVAVLGASTKGNVITQWLGLSNRELSFASERSPEKVGLYTAGTGIPIVSEEEARARKPDNFLLLPYAFADEVIQRETPYLTAGGKIVVPLPVPYVVNKGEKTLLRRPL